MIDDFVQRPKTPRRRPSSKTPSTTKTDFLPDLSKPATIKPAEPAAKNEPFITPEEAAAQDTKVIIDDTIDLTDKTPTDAEPPKERWWTRFGAWFGAQSKKKKALIIVLVIILLGGVGGGAFALTRPEPAPAPKAVVKPEPKPVAPTTVANTLTGRQVAPELNEKPVIAVMVENSVDARPQSGLSDAGVVFEAIAEGGITRFVALYQDTAPESIGPVRSARPYYIDWIMGFDAAYAHAGGSPEALQLIGQLGVKDLNDHKSYFQRNSSRFAPHNLYTSHTLLSQYATSKGYTKSDFTGFSRKADAASKAPTAKSISLNISSVKYNVQYTYDAATNSYLRNLAGAPHIDVTGSKQITPKVVVAMVMNYSLQADHKHSQYNTIGSGPVTVFQDGVATTGTWAKTSKDSQITFTDAAGKPIKLNAGQTWLTMVNNPGSIVSAP